MAMNRYGRSVTLLLFLWLSWPSGIQAADDTKGTEKVIELDAITIEAEREREDLPRSIIDLERSFDEPFIREKVFSDRIEEESIPDVKSALKEIPNVSVRESGAFTKQIEIRGLSGDRVIAVVDGVRIGNQGMTHSGGGEVNLIDIGTVDSIEVVKGAPAVVYDPGATGGVIRVETREIPEKDHLQFKYTLGQDGGLDKTRNAASLSASKYGLGVGLFYSQTDASDYRVKDQGKLDAILRRTNELSGRTGTPFEIKDLGFEDESRTLNLGYRFGANHKLSFQRTDYEANDISFTHGAIDSIVFHVDALTRETDQFRYRIDHLGPLRDLSLAYADQRLARSVTASRSILDSRSVNATGVIPIRNTKLTLGGEWVDDRADTQVLSNQDYLAGYLNAESLHDRFTWTAGARVNRWEAQARLPQGRDPSIVADLVSVNGPFNPATGAFAPLQARVWTYATGLVYVLNKSNNLSLNYSKTHRFPSLFERFAVGGFTGGGFALDAEGANNIETAWKFHRGPLFAVVSIFYSDFDDYITLKERRRLTDPIALQACIRAGDCDPLRGEFDGREPEFFAVDFPFFNVKQVVNRGFEISLKRIEEKHSEVGFSLGMNDFKVGAVYDPADQNLVLTQIHPLEVKVSVKKYLSEGWGRPWGEIKGRYVSNTPQVEQKEGFDDFFVVDLFAGFRFPVKPFSTFNFNAGIRNLANTVYHEPFSALDGLKRSFFFNIGVEI